MDTIAEHPIEHMLLGSPQPAGLALRRGFATAPAIMRGRLERIRSLDVDNNEIFTEKPMATITSPTSRAARRAPYWTRSSAGPPVVGAFQQKRYREASFQLGTRVLGQRSYSLCEDVSVETMAITALPMDVWLKERLKKWVQLSGHEGSIVPASCKTLYKKQEGHCSEARAYEVISRDVELDGFTPKYYQQLQKNEESFIEIEDLLQQFSDPSKVSIMDIKIGARTFLESEVSNTKRRADLYQKMIAIDPTEPTPEEHEHGEITKLRYMQFRERESSSAQLGFRIEAAKMPGGSLQKNFKKVRTPDDVARTLIDFLGAERDRVREALLRRITKMREAIERSQFFRTHEVVGSSILIVHDNEKVGCWMIDFAKSHPVMDGRDMDHRTPWIPGNHEDGYLMGIDNLVQILEDLPPMGSLPDELPVR